ncbi:hypothetical protein [Lawsonibacter faecis]|jgi:hypothetical protein|uniref:Uncharacterized protein n=1 Tax=Lawsonibacter faecis TaxID=2763052 RepID=A0A8J6JLH5_9FIRM|nr:MULTISPECIES: hypothetical protein [Oscillospiraceae]MTQ97761.1 hypothetical protein [Pseudoflavonifractor sp. BIOML-A16]MTR06748.1 hypothetical protein [Pseudoflavonifractor sp. BIOML-A15]MTR33256.1 hypothetical protein [Pseudoflavonifractor sp. BIOML-A14]MTR36813.1 hypothetical protein [Pseudoflavonifractor sp. BIOML-A9]MTR74000.1 hypothetical protein [Pseudoflavonifractor sp. BIOML-A18]MTS64770.1 hypothetical protein [Pseudoflavonifractor sp. BIOML-A5]MTS72962.1 hypothetical protein [P
MYHTEEKYPLSKRDVRPEAAERAIILMCMIASMFIGMSLLTPNPRSLLLNALLPLVLCILFVLRKRPVFGILYTALFFAVRLYVLFFVRPSRVGWIVLIAVGGFYIYTDMQAVRLWKYRHQTS